MLEHEVATGRRGTGHRAEEAHTEDSKPAANHQQPGDSTRFFINDQFGPNNIEVISQTLPEGAIAVGVQAA